MPHRSRGFSLSLVLMVAAIVMVVGLALGALCSVSLNLAAQLLSQRKSELLARAVVAQVQYELDFRVWNRPYYSFSYPDMIYGQDALKKRFKEIPVFPDGGRELLDGGAHKAAVTFDATELWYSVDNLIADFARPSFLDVGTPRTSVPAFSLNLMVNTDVLNEKRHFETTISRVWPYAAYCIQTPVVANAGSTVKGSIFDGRSDVEIGDPPAKAKPPSLVDGDVCVPAARGSNAVRIQPGSDVTGLIRYRVPVSTGSTASDDPMALLNFTAPAPWGGGDVPVTLGDGLAREVDSYGVERLLTVAEFRKALLNDGKYDSTTTSSGNGQPGSKPSPSPTPNVNDLLKKLTFYNRAGKVTDLRPFISRVRFRTDDGNTETLILGEDVRLENGVFTTSSLTNHFGVYDGRLQTDDLYTGGRLILDNAVLVVSGDLDIRDLVGDNSALYVSGNLFLSNGKLEAKNKGMLIMASNVVLEAGGSFRGLIGARGAMVFRPLVEGQRLEVRGALLAGGQAIENTVYDVSGKPQLPDGAYALTIASTDLVHDPRYTRALNRFGVSRIRVFREVR